MKTAPVQVSGCFICAQAVPRIQNRLRTQEGRHLAHGRRLPYALQDFQINEFRQCKGLPRVQLFAKIADGTRRPRGQKVDPDGRIDKQQQEIYLPARSFL